MYSAKADGGDSTMMMSILKILNNVPSDTTRKGVLAEHYEDRKRTIGELLKSPMTLSQGAAIMNEYKGQTDCHAETGRGGRGERD